MTRTRLFTAVAASAVLILGGCSSTAGVATAGDETSGNSSSSSSSGTPSDDASANSQDSETGTATGGESSDPTSTSPSAPADGGDDADDADAVTDPSGVLDPQSAAWFNSACAGLKPVVTALMQVAGAGMAGALAGMGADDTDSTSAAPDPKALQQGIVTAMNAASKAMAATADRLGDVPPPTIDQGEKLASTTVTALKSYAPLMKQAADQLAAMDITDMESLSAAMQTISDQMEQLEDNENIGALSLMGDDSDLPPEIRDAVMALPACVALNPFAGMMSDTPAPTTTG